MLDTRQVHKFLLSKHWLDQDHDWRFIHPHHPYVILASGEDGQVTLREQAEGLDNGQNGEEIFNFLSLNELQEWYENNIGE